MLTYSQLREEKHDGRPYYYRRPGKKGRAGKVAKLGRHLVFQSDDIFEPDFVIADRGGTNIYHSKAAAEQVVQEGERNMMSREERDIRMKQVIEERDRNKASRENLERQVKQERERNAAAAAAAAAAAQESNRLKAEIETQLKRTTSNAAKHDNAFKDLVQRSNVDKDALNAKLQKATRDRASMEGKIQEIIAKLIKNTNAVKGRRGSNDILQELDAQIDTLIKLEKVKLDEMEANLLRVNNLLQESTRSKSTTEDELARVQAAKTKAEMELGSARQDFERNNGVYEALKTQLETSLDECNTRLSTCEESLREKELEVNFEKENARRAAEDIESKTKPVIAKLETQVENQKRYIIEENKTCTERIAAERVKAVAEVKQINEGMIEEQVQRQTQTVNRELAAAKQLAEATRRELENTKTDLQNQKNTATQFRQQAEAAVTAAAAAAESERNKRQYVELQLTQQQQQQQDEAAKQQHFHQHKAHLESEYNKQLQVAADAAAAAAVEVKDCHEQLQLVKQEAAQAQQERDTAQQEREQLQLQAKNAADAADAADAAAVTAQEEVTNIQEERRATETILDGCRAEVDTLRQEREQLIRQHDETEAEKQLLRSEYDSRIIQATENCNQRIDDLSLQQKTEFAEQLEELRSGKEAAEAAAAAAAEALQDNIVANETSTSKRDAIETDFEIARDAIGVKVENLERELRAAREQKEDAYAEAQRIHNAYEEQLLSEQRAREDERRARENEYRAREEEARVEERRRCDEMVANLQQQMEDTIAAAAAPHNDEDQDYANYMSREEDTDDAFAEGKEADVDGFTASPDASPVSPAASPAAAPAAAAAPAPAASPAPAPIKNVTRRNIRHYTDEQLRDIERTDQERMDEQVNHQSTRKHRVPKRRVPEMFEDSSPRDKKRMRDDEDNDYNDDEDDDEDDEDVNDGDIVVDNDDGHGDNGNNDGDNDDGRDVGHGDDVDNGHGHGDGDGDEVVDDDEVGVDGVEVVDGVDDVEVVDGVDGVDGDGDNGDNGDNGHGVDGVGVQSRRNQTGMLQEASHRYLNRSGLGNRRTRNSISSRISFLPVFRHIHDKEAKRMQLQNTAKRQKREGVLNAARARVTGEGPSASNSSSRVLLRSHTRAAKLDEQAAKTQTRKQAEITRQMQEQNGRKNEYSRGGGKSRKSRKQFGQKKKVKKNGKRSTKKILPGLAPCQGWRRRVKRRTAARGRRTRAIAGR